MHARDLVELAAMASLHGALIIDSEAPLAQENLERYWAASKCRLDRWGRALKRSAETSGLPRSEEENCQLLGVLEEILTGDVLGRVWAAVLAGHDRRRVQDGGTVARSILIGQQEACNRAMSVLVNDPAVAPAHALLLNRLRRRAECWSDLLVGYLGLAEDVSEFAAEPARAREFAGDFRREGTRTWPLLFASLRASFSSAFKLASPNADLNAEIAASVISCFQPELFDSTGLLRSLWLSRLQRTTNETQCMVEALFADEHGSQAGEQAVGGRDLFRRRFSY
jgi:hypothetical protein